MGKKSSFIWEIPSDILTKIVNESNSYTDVLKSINVNDKGGCYLTLRARIEKENINIAHFKKSGRKRNSIPLSEILVENSSYSNRTRLKERLIREGLLEEKCSCCGIGTEWNGKKLALQLEHRNGINNDNRLENLCLLCPNCHSQTPTYGGKRSKCYINCIYCFEPLIQKRKSGMCVKCYKEFIKKEEHMCVICEIPVSRHSKSKMCISCSNKNRNNSNQRKVKNRPSRHELINLILNNTFIEISNIYGVSDNSIRKWCKSEGIPYRKKEIDVNRLFLEEELKNNLINN